VLRGGIRHLDRESLGGEKAHEPAAHLAGTTNDQRPASGAGAARDHARLFLRGERGADEQAQQLLGERRRHATLGRRGAHPQDHLALALIVARRPSGGALDARDLLAHGLALGHQRDQLAVELGHSPAQVLQRHGVGFGRHGTAAP